MIAFCCLNRKFQIQFPITVLKTGDSENVWKVIFTTNPSGTVIFQKQVEPGGVSVGKLRLEKSPEVPLITSGEAHAAKKKKQTNKLQ